MAPIPKVPKLMGAPGFTLQSDNAQASSVSVQEDDDEKRTPVVKYTKHTPWGYGSASTVDASDECTIPEVTMCEEDISQELFPKRTIITPYEHRDTWNNGDWRVYQQVSGMTVMKGKDGVIKFCKSKRWRLTSSSNSRTPAQPLQLPPKHLPTKTPSNIVASSGEVLPEFECHKSDPMAVLASMKWPENINEWGKLQPIIWRGHPRLPQGWIRVWSKTWEKEYYLRLADKKTTFVFDELSEIRQESLPEKSNPRPPVEPPPIHLLPMMMVCPYCKWMTVNKREVPTNFCSRCGKDIKGP